MNYQEFIQSKRHTSNNYGFEPIWMPDSLFDFQKYIVEKSMLRGRLGDFLDTGLGKSRIALTLAQNIVLKTNKPVLILTPLAVAFQFLKEAEAIGIDDVEHTKNGKFSKKIVLCNFERLHYLNNEDFIGVLTDESGILKNFNASIKNQIIAFVKKIPYRYLLSATPAPNDFIELGNSAEALGELGYMDMLQKFFKSTQNDIDSNNRNIGEQWRLKPHAENAFFEWVNSWSIMVKKPSDIGFSDDLYILPKLTENFHWVDNEAKFNKKGQLTLFTEIAKTMTEVRHEQKQTEQIRCEKAIELAKGKTSVYWCNTNNESAILKKLDDGAVELIGSQSIDQKEEILKGFSEQKFKRLITKAKITSHGLNWQHCCHSVFFPTWSYESYYQAYRRFWRFGQVNEVVIDIVISKGQERVIRALEEKKIKAKTLYENLLNNVKGDFNIIKKEEIQEIKKPMFI